MQTNTLDLLAEPCDRLGRNGNKDEQKVAAEMRAHIGRIVGNLKELLPHLTHTLNISTKSDACSLVPVNIALVVPETVIHGQKRTLLISNEGLFIYAAFTPCPKCKMHYTIINDAGHGPTWERFPFQAVLRGMGNLLDEGIKQTETSAKKLKNERSLVTLFVQNLN